MLNLHSGGTLVEYAELRELEHHQQQRAMCHLSTFGLLI